MIINTITNINNNKYRGEKRQQQEEKQENLIESARALQGITLYQNLMVNIKNEEVEVRGGWPPPFIHIN